LFPNQQRAGPRLTQRLSRVSTCVALGKT
jgi:hypothetical protein